jgi:hypothetical protein
MLALYGALRWITSAGDKEGLAAAKKIITAAIIGLMIAFSIWAVFYLVKGFFGLGKGGGGSGGGSGGGPAAGSITCIAQCQTQSCQGGEGWCFNNCRCICDSSGKRWAYEARWCDRDNKWHECQGNSNIDTGKKCP